MTNKTERAEAPVSPVTNSTAVRLAYGIGKKDIVRLYKDQVNYDVSRYFNGVDQVRVYECMDTGYRFYYPFSVEGDAQFYEDLQRLNASGGGDYYRHWEYDHRFAYEHINAGDTVLEIGCGTGSFLQKLKEKTDNAHGLELNRNAVKQCREKGLNVYGELVQVHAETRKEYYDVVCAFQVLEHVTAVKEFLDACLAVLKPGGKLIFGVPNNEPYYQRWDKYATFNLPPHHLGLWSPKAFQSLERFFPIKLITRTYDVPGRWKSDAYLRAKNWLGIKSLPQTHTKGEKLMMLALAPVAVPLSLFRQWSSRIPGAYIAVMFEKSSPGR